MSSSATTMYFFNSTSAVHTLAVEHPRTNNNLPYSYGTSGFRGLASTLPAVTLRMGFFAALRSLSFHTAAGGQASVVGVMVTASHNDAPDNGVKLIDPDGSMMATDWEHTATQLANTPEQEVGAFLKQLTQQLKLNLESSKPRVFVGRDTRHSSPELCALVVEGVQALGGEVVDYGVVTTPQLHWVVKRANEGKEATVDSYYKTLSSAFSRALRGKPGTTTDKPPSLPPLIVDCANGVGSLSLQHFAPLLPQLPLQLVNTSRTERLNDECGAEHVQKTHKLPKVTTTSTTAAASGAVTHPIPVPLAGVGATAPEHTMDLVDTAISKASASTSDASNTASSSSPSTSPFTPHARLASVDGDADRLVYYYIDDAQQLHLLDGDKIITLYTTLLTNLIARSPALSQPSHTPTIGIVQTGYANGSSTAYIRKQLHIEPRFTPSGVKHLHHVAAEYDIGIYFESNGHGTVLFKPDWLAKVRGAAGGGEEGGVVECVLALVELVNQCVGDAVSDLLLVEVALHILGWSLADWDAIYTDLPSSTLKVKVKDRSVITTTNAERTCVTPEGLQAEIDRLVGSGEGRRAFVRPSGTEDIVRVYAEAPTREEVDVLGKQVCDAVLRLAGGIQ